MSKERAIRRAAREAEEAKAKAVRARTVARRAKRRELKRRLTPTLPKRRRIGKMFPRRTSAERAILGGGFAVLLFLIWYEFDDLPTQIALTAILVLATPIAAVVAFGRRS